MKLLRARDWEATPLGPIEDWPPVLRHNLSTIMAARLPMMLLWGPELIELYNDAFIPHPGAKHPRSFGSRMADTWVEVFDELEPLISGVRAGGAATWASDQLLLLGRAGYTEETYYTFSYSPIKDEAGAIPGVLTVAVETTAQVVEARRNQLLIELSGPSDRGNGVAGVARTALSCLDAHPADVPFALLYLREGEQAELAAATESAVPLAVPSLGPGSRWPIPRGHAVTVDDLSYRFDATDLPAGLLDLPVRRARLLPLHPGGDAPDAVLVLGLSPTRPLDNGYLDFCDHVAGHVERRLRTRGDPRTADGHSSAVAAHPAPGPDGLLRRAQEAERRQAELDDARRVAEAADRLKTRFLSMVSHEMRTPLNGIIGMTAMLLDDAVDADQREQLSTIRDSGDHLLGLINELLDLGRIESGGVRLEEAPTDLTHCLHDALDIVRPLAAEKGLDLRHDAPETLTVLTDAGRVRQVLMNLLSNAIKFTDEGAVHVRLETVAGLGPRRSARFVVTDTGPGLAEEVVGRAFTPFVQADDSQTRTGGTGLGLSISRALARRLNGDVTVLDPGPGAVFAFTMSGPAVTRTAARSATEPALDRTTASRLPLRILVADDVRANQLVARQMLERLGYRPDVVGDGVEAVQAVLRQDYDLVLMDVQMPALDGLSAAREIIRAVPASRRPRIIGVSASATERDYLDAHAAGMEGYLTKPLRPAALVAALQQDTGEEPPPVEPPPESGPGVLALGQAQELRELFGADFPAAVTQWYTEADAELRRMQGAREAGDLAAIRAGAHAIMGGAMGVGASEVTALADEIGGCARAGDVAELARFTALAVALARAHLALANLPSEDCVLNPPARTTQPQEAEG